MEFCWGNDRGDQRALLVLKVPCNTQAERAAARREGQTTQGLGDTLELFLRPGWLDVGIGGNLMFSIKLICDGVILSFKMAISVST